MAGLTLAPLIAADPTALDLYSSAQSGAYYRQFSAAGAAGDATTIQAAGAAGTRHIVTAIVADVDTAGETLAIKSASSVLVTLRFPVPDVYQIRFDPPLECGAAEALSLDKGTTAAINGRIYYIPAYAKPS